MISDEAVQAAANEISAVDYPNYEPDLDLARKVLEAAAPYMLAQAWEEGEKIGYSNCVSVENGLSQTPNPYEPAGSGE